MYILELYLAPTAYVLDYGSESKQISLDRSSVFSSYEVNLPEQWRNLESKTKTNQPRQVQSLQLRWGKFPWTMT